VHPAGGQGGDAQVSSFDGEGASSSSREGPKRDFLTPGSRALHPTSGAAAMPAMPALPAQRLCEASLLSRGVGVSSHVQARKEWALE
jgi:hypothetical protein